MVTMRGILTLMCGCLISMVTSQIHVTLPDPIITYHDGALQFTIKDAGYRLVSFHYNVNKPLAGVSAADHAYDVTSKEGGQFVLRDSSVQLQPGDKVNYWTVAIRQADNVGMQITDRAWTYVEEKSTATTTTTTTTTKPTTRPTSTEATTTRQTKDASTPPNGIQSNTVTLSRVQQATAQERPSTTSGVGANGDHSVNTGSGSGNGGCGFCNYGPGHGDGYVDDRACQSFPCLILEDNFDFLNHRIWEHEITAGGGGNWEFQYYTNNRTNSYTRDGILYIKPTLTSDHFGADYLEHGNLELWGGSSPADVCTSNAFWGCKREGRPGQVINPVQSARLRSSRGFNFRYGKVEVEAKMPAGDWLWPAIWMLPRRNVYGQWPASGEIDLVESRGNRDYRDPQGNSIGVDNMGSTLHFGADYFTNKWPTAHVQVAASSGTFADGFHKYGLEWDNTSITFSLDGQETLRVAPGSGGFWKYGGLDQLQGYDNPWRAGSRMAPFDQEFFLLLNVAVGGTAFFPDENINSPTPKPWQDGAGHEADRFWGARGQWYPTWNPDQRNGEDAAMQVNYVRVWKTRQDPL